MSLLIRKVELTDNGSFFCRVELDQNYFEAKIDLCVEAKPKILSLSVVDEPCGSGSAPRWLRCEFEGHPLPQIVWLKSSRRLLEPQGRRMETGPYRGISCVP
ncbi:hemicentin-2-like [Mugil cephalus]|uniref:hemicentin-2-like n=1 Tax=Mugil cephalus TaxID=48193 RepID=UPI001FB7FB43|nr:hemicentin-2-like [Mugil cephalus]